MKKKELVAKAQELYPKGTVFIDPISNWEITSSGKFRASKYKNVYDEGTNGIVYSASEDYWAKIKSIPVKPEEVTLFENSNAQIVVSKGKILIKSEFCSICIAPEALELVLKTYREIND